MRPPILSVDEQTFGAGAEKGDVLAVHIESRIAYREPVRWTVKDYGDDQRDACMMLSQCGKVRLGNFVDPKYTMGAAIAKKYL